MNNIIDYYTIKELSVNWRISERQVLNYCLSDKIPGTIRVGNMWLIPKNAQKPIDQRFKSIEESAKYLALDSINEGDSKILLKRIEHDSISLSVWSPPYHVGKKYEEGQTYEEWQNMLQEVIALHFNILKPGGFLAINIGDILVFRDPSMPKIQAQNLSMRKCSVTEEDVIAAKLEHPDYSRHQLAKLLGCSEQTIQRRLYGNNIRGGKYEVQTRIKTVGGMIEEFATKAGLFLYDRRVWVKDPAWANCNWTSNSYRSVDEFEYLYIFWKPGETIIDRARLSSYEWTQWGSRAVWYIKSVQKNDDHESKFPIELPLRTIKLLTDPNDIVLDCFMGSGTTALAALSTKRHYIGIDISHQSVMLSKKNIDEYLKHQ